MNISKSTIIDIATLDIKKDIFYTELTGGRLKGTHLSTRLEITINSIDYELLENLILQVVDFFKKIKL